MCHLGYGLSLHQPRQDAWQQGAHRGQRPPREHCQPATYISGQGSSEGPGRVKGQGHMGKLSPRCQHLPSTASPACPGPSALQGQAHVSLVGCTGKEDKQAGSQVCQFYLDKVRGYEPAQRGSPVTSRTRAVAHHGIPGVPSLGTRNANTEQTH